MIGGKATGRGVGLQPTQKAWPREPFGTPLVSSPKAVWTYPGASGTRGQAPQNTCLDLIGKLLPTVLLLCRLRPSSQVWHAFVAAYSVVSFLGVSNGLIIHARSFVVGDWYHQRTTLNCVTAVTHECSRRDASPSCAQRLARTTPTRAPRLRSGRVHRARHSAR